jgi:hypothetical protein
MDAMNWKQKTRSHPLQLLPESCERALHSGKICSAVRLGSDGSLVPGTSIYVAYVRIRVLVVVFA